MLTQSSSISDPDRAFSAARPVSAMRDKADLCSCGYCWRSIHSLLQQEYSFVAAHAAKTVIQYWYDWNQVA